VNVTTEIPGIVREIAFESGAVVTNGALLLRLDTSLEEAQLRALESQVELANVNAVRARELRAAKRFAVELDTAEATLKQNQATLTLFAQRLRRKPFARHLLEGSASAW